ncbi:LamG-like jellyroll fold domain-containing protein [Nubsella zeaxanthinifaciens]|uniref:LamG-like jellyroll fold domain-containing protein n=1 Tax=Nubsella zeaxanthinifaciens TaxID=392412 RepID=UPI000DE1AFE7|nr:LamG-like jellyroll fold domain-containing protein [Nubsella zeaxanthinifaciens]
MNSNSDGLSPNLKPFLGIGWNRALPSAFGFGNGIRPYPGRLNVPNMVGKPVLNEFSVEFWYKALSITGFSVGGIFIATDNTGSYHQITQSRNGAFGIRFMKGPGGTNSNTVVGNSTTEKFHFVLTFKNGVSNLYINAGDSVFSGTSSSGSVGNLSGVYSDYRIFYGDSDNNGSFSNFQSTTFECDEFRVYSKALTPSEIALNFNARIGENPCVTEFLKLWYKFEQFESLDFSALQDNSDIRTGIRDLSGNNNHAQPIGMDTNPASPNYVLKPF